MLSQLPNRVWEPSPDEPGKWVSRPRTRDEHANPILERAFQNRGYTIEEVSKPADKDWKDLQEMIK